MQYTHLTNTQEKVSRIALGTMMYGEQVDQTEAFAQMEFTLENGINFWDTAQMYTIPPKAETFGNSEKIIGKFFQKNPKARKKVFLASKFSARGIRKMDWIYDGNHFANKDHITWALEESLKKLQTDHIDLYQIHWPDRSANVFGKTNIIKFSTPHPQKNKYSPS